MRYSLTSPECSEKLSLWLRDNCVCQYHSRTSLHIFDGGRITSCRHCIEMLLGHVCIFHDVVHLSILFIYHNVCLNYPTPLQEKTS